MKLFAKAGLFAVFIGISTAAPSFADPINPVVTATTGSGPYESFFVVNFQDGPDSTNNPASNFVFGYYWNPANGTPTGQDMINALTDPKTGVGLTVDETWFPGFGEYFIDGFSYKGHTQDPPGGYDAVHGFYWSYWWSNADRLGASLTDWDYADTGAGDEILSNGSYDGWVYSDGSASPVTPHNTIAPGSAAVLVVNAPTNASAGAPFTFTVTAEDSSGNVVTGYKGKVHFVKSDRFGSLPADTTLTNGTGTFPATLGTAGSQVISAIDTADNLSGTSGGTQVAPGTAAGLSSRLRGPFTSGVPFSLNIYAVDAFGNTATGYTGKVHFTSSDASAILPADSTLTSGQGSFSITPYTSGIQSVAAADTVTSSFKTSQSFTVVTYPAVRFRVGLSLTAAAAGTPETVTVTALDANGNTARGYTGMVHFTTGDPQATLPADTALVNGVGTFSVAFKTAGRYTVIATDTASSSISGATGFVTISAGTATQLTAAIPASSIAANKPFGVVVKALDAYGNLATGYTGTIHITSSDAGAVLPADSLLYSGQHTFLVTAKTVGNQTVTATDTGNAGLTATTNPVSITAH